MGARRVAVLVALTFGPLVHGTMVAVGQRAVEQPVFRSGADLARIEVSILDQSRTPIRKLSAGDFILEVDGRREPVLLVSEVEAGDHVNAGYASPRDVRDNQTSGARLFAIIMDDAQTPLDPFVARTARNSALEVVKGLLPTDLVTVVYTWDVQKGQEFTNDRTKLIASIERFRPGPQSPLAAIYASRTVSGVLAAMHALPANQRNVVLISPGVRRRSGGFAMIGSFDADSDMDWGFEGNDTLRTLGGRQLARIPVYAVDIMGLVAPTDARTGASAASFSAHRQGAEWLKTIASASGGYAITETNDPLPALRKAIKETDVYYVLGFRPPPSGRTHRIRVRVKDRSGSTALIRQYSAIRNPRQDTQSLKHALAGFLPLSGVPMQLMTRAFPTGERESDLVVGLKLAAPPGEATPEPPLHVQWRIFNDWWKEVFVQNVAVGATELVTSGAEGIFFLRTRLPPGRYHVRVAVRGASWRSAASVFGDVTIAVADDTPQVADPMMFAPSKASKSPTWFASISPAVPDFSRTFAIGDKVQSVIVLSTAGAPAIASLAVKVIDEHSVVKSERTVALPIECQKVCGFSTPISSEGLPVGRYVLQVIVSVGKRDTERQSVFQIK